MKNNTQTIIVLLAIVIVAIFVFLFVAPVEEQEMKNNIDSSEVTVVEPSLDATVIEKDEMFLIILDSNPSTGYSWATQYDTQYFELLESKYIPEKVEEGVVGSGGQQVTLFRTLKEGNSEIGMYYVREWEENVEPVDQKIYKISIQ